MRLTGTSMDCFKYLEPLYLDYRKLRYMNKDGGEQSHLNAISNPDHYLIQFVLFSI